MAGSNLESICCSWLRTGEQGTLSHKASRMDVCIGLWRLRVLYGIKSFAIGLIIRVHLQLAYKQGTRIKPETIILVLGCRLVFRKPWFKSGLSQTSFQIPCMYTSLRIKQTGWSEEWLPTTTQESLTHLLKKKRWILSGLAKNSLLHGLISFPFTCLCTYPAPCIRSVNYII